MLSKSFVSCFLFWILFCFLFRLLTWWSYTFGCWRIDPFITRQPFWLFLSLFFNFYITVVMGRDLPSYKERRAEILEGLSSGKNKKGDRENVTLDSMSCLFNHLRVACRQNGAISYDLVRLVYHHHWYHYNFRSLYLSIQVCVLWNSCVLSVEWREDLEATSRTRKFFNKHTLTHTHTHTWRPIVLSSQFQ